MKTGEIVRLKPILQFASDWGIPPQAIGTVLCRYRIPAHGTTANDRLDVRFGLNKVIWGGPVGEFDMVDEAASLSNDNLMTD